MPTPLKIRYLVSSLLVAGLAACATATEPVSGVEAVDVPYSRILDAKYLKPTSTSGEISIRRDRGFAGAACSTRIFLNGMPLADIETAQKIVIYLPPGEYLIGARPNGICGGGLTEARASVSTGARLAFRFGTSGNGSPSIYPTTP